MAQITLNSTGVASSGALVLQSNGTTTAVTIDASQNVSFVGAQSINTTMATTTTYKTDMTLQAQPASGTTGTSSAGGVQLLFKGTTDGSIANSTLAAVVGFAQTDSVNNAGGLAIRCQESDGSGLVDSARFASSGLISLRGATNQSSGSGIAFPATQLASSNANTLDDYEEGTYTPTPTSITVVSGTPVYSGKYTKIGNIVQAFFQMSGGNITITGGSSNLSLPFTAPTVDATGGYTNGATGLFVGGVLAYCTVMIFTTGVTSNSISGSIVYRVA